MPLELLAKHPIVDQVGARLGREHLPLAVSGLWGSSAPMLVCAVAARLARPFLYLVAHAEQADAAADDLETISGRRPLTLPAWELTPGQGAASDEIAAERTRLCALLRGDDAPPPVVAPVQAVMQPVPTAAALDAASLLLKTGDLRDPMQIAEWLAARGFTRLDEVEQAGDFAVRGGIVDIAASNATDPIRIEFFGDRIESIRSFDIATKRSVRDLPQARISVAPSATDAAPNETTTFFEYLPPDAFIVIHEPMDIQEMGRALLDRLGNPAGMFPVDAVFRLAARRNLVYLGRFESSAADESHRLDVTTRALPPFEAHAADAVAQLVRLCAEHPLIVYCDAEGERERLGELARQSPPQTDSAEASPGAPNSAAVPLDVRVGQISQGFTWHAAEGVPLFSLVGHHEVFHRHQRRRRMRAVAAARPIESFLDLEEGDYVVHATHGIARFVGLKSLDRDNRGRSEEFLSLRFAADAMLHVPASQIELVQKYVGPGGSRPSLSALGGNRWKQARAQVEEAVTDFAADLLRIQAEREAQQGVGYPDDTHWQREFEASFVYTETADQLRALIDLKTDMRRPRPMDRLLCGDVGYGKTELAVRAAFKVAEYGKQTAVLVPTTVLAEQHFETFRERMAEYPFVVDRLSRFRSARETQEILQRTRRGEIDVLIGTHRLLSRDVHFADLGLVVVDEEQRFGVEHKERLKQLRSTVDVLTLTATPIPRTLHMAMVGLRDISALETPPMDRRSIVTRVVHFSRDLIREAVVRELNRDGQVFFVHNRVKSIERMRDRLAEIVPEARILIGHGQMPGDALEEVMLRFIRREADVLLCTTIIESGIDIPTANTILIDQADNFGLADLHQLRGRVGRYKHRAFCYLLIPNDRPLTQVAARRLKAIEEFSELGSGFRIAMRDLEIRGAGNILGPEQSGHIAAVGYELYCKLLEQAVARMKGAPLPIAPEVYLELGFDAHVPRSYIRADRQRMEIYRRVASCRSVADVEQAERDIRDAYGPPPPPVQTMLDLADLRLRAAPWKVRTVQRREPDLIFTVEDVRLADALFKGATGSVRLPDPQTVHWRVPESYFSQETLLAILRRLFGKPLP